MRTPNRPFTEAEISELQQLQRNCKHAKVVLKASILLRLSNGQSMAGIAAETGVRKSAIYEWWARARDESMSMEQRLLPGVHTGRPADLRDQVRALLTALMEEKPEDHGFPHQEWTTELLQTVLEQKGVSASFDTIRRALHGLGFRWKRPRFVLSRRDPNWKHAKGGLKKGFSHADER